MQAEGGAQEDLQAQIGDLQHSLDAQEREILQLNARLLSEISQYYERQWTDTLQSVVSGYATHKTQYFTALLGSF